MAEADQLGGFGGGLRSTSALSHRPIGRPAPAPIGPIGPIGRPRHGELHHGDEAFGGSSKLPSSSSASGSGPASPKLPEGILGSAALGGDDELIEPKPRRTSNTVPINGGVGGGFFGGLGGGNSAFGMSSASPWGSFAGNGPTGSMGGGPLSPGFANAAPGPPGSAGLGPGVGAGGSGIDPWARAQTSWDRARSAFEQPPGAGGLVGNGGLLHGGGSSGLGDGQAGNPMNAFGAARNMFGGAGGPPNSGASAIGSMLSPTSPGSRHRGGDL